MLICLSLLMLCKLNCWQDVTQEPNKSIFLEAVILALRKAEVVCFLAICILQIAWIALSGRAQTDSYIFTSGIYTLCVYFLDTHKLIAGNYLFIAGPFSHTQYD